MRRWLAAASLALAAGGCAHMQPPPGGPEDKTPPVVIATRPDTLAVVPGYRGNAVIVFDERISEQGVEDAVSVSPRTSAARVDHSGDEIRVSLVRGWEPGRIYQITVAPGLKDLFGNVITQPVQLVFSTGPAIPGTRATGTVVQRTTGEAVKSARVEAIHQPDSLVYAVQTDSVGRFVFSRIPEGDYRVRAFTDVNRNRALDVFEARDTARIRVAVGTVPDVRLRLLLPDTTPPKLGSARIENGIVKAVFDDFLDRAQAITAAQVTLLGPDSLPVPLAEVVLGDLARPDTGAAARDTSRTRPDTAGGVRPAGGVAGRDTLPAKDVSIRPAATLRPGAEYRVTITGVRNINGLVGGGTVTTRAPLAPETPAPPAAGAPAQDTAAPNRPAGRPAPEPNPTSPPPPAVAAPPAGTSLPPGGSPPPVLPPPAPPARDTTTAKPRP